ncbi:MAG: 2-dehydro-3-deoxy-6-phosphogalactonate aldolase [Rhodospirillaceae bacterium]|nr:2-dehydro-3-deoxy-6-phosphogalactonate aldolase [Rhodospirillaceae bacterium]MBT7731837.1 2-dehydro-3-deoxy-6-phosphogalactonate aldolase [Rhodospirillaceae bacterium]
MANFLSFLKESPLIAILRGITPAEVIEISETLVEKNFKIIEIPLNSPDPIESIEMLVSHFKDEVIIGAGTVTDLTSIKLIVEAGARLSVMPNGSIRIVKAAKASGLITIPGVFTPTEAFAMIESGADALKLFPAEGAPPMVLKAMKAVLPTAIPILPVGGITPDKMAEYQKAGANGFGLGSALYKPGMTVDEVAQNADAFNEGLKRSARDL